MSTPLKAIRKFCFICIVDPGVPGGGTAAEQMEGCLDTECPLHEFRPLTGKTKKHNRQEIIDQMSPEELVLHEKRIEQAKIRFGHTKV